MQYDIKILKNYIKYLSLKNLSSKTITVYYGNIKVFFEFIIKYLKFDIAVKDMNVFLLAKIDVDIIIAFIINLKEERKVINITVHNYVIALKSFFTWLYNKYPTMFKDVENPMNTLGYSRLRTIKLPKYISLNEAIKIQNIFNEKNCRNCERNNAIISLFLNTGLRLSELVSLNINDIDFNNKMTKVIGKRNKERNVYLNDKICKKLRKYLLTRTDDIEALFISGANKRISVREVQRICERAYKLANLGEYEYTTHTLRHTYATYMYQSTKDILLIKKLLGHDSIMSTQIYTHVMNEELKHAVDSNPLNII